MIVLSQGIDIKESADIPVPEYVMQDVIRRILVYKIKPANRKKVIYLAQSRINRSWLPEIKNIEFRLLTNGEVEDIDRGVYFFTKPELENGTYEIGVGFGDPGCEYVGDSWRFRIAKDKVRLWLEGGIGGGCGGGNSFGEFSEPGQLNNYPNELEGYRFFDIGKLRGLKLTISDRESVLRNFGNNCKDLCDYDQNWEVYFSYFGDVSFEKTINDSKVKYVPKAEYVGKLYSISLRPKSDILFSKKIFPSRFKKSNGYSAAHDGQGGGTNTSYYSYSDRYGLIYTILDEVTLTTIKDLRWKKGELTSIEYTIPDKLEEKMFIEQN